MDMAITVSIMANTAITVPNKPRHSDRPVAAALLALAVGCVAVGLGFPSVMASFQAVGAAESLFALRQGRPVLDESLLPAADSVGKALNWMDQGGLWKDRGTLLYAAWMTAASETKRSLLAAEAERSLLETLRNSPAQPAAWAYLARLKEARGDDPGAVQALRMSILTGQTQPNLFRLRLEMADRLRSHLDADFLSMLRQQIRLYWLVDPKAVAELGKRPGLSGLINDALAQLSPAEIDLFVRQQSRR